MAFTRDKMGWHPAWNDVPQEGQSERGAPSQDQNFGSWDQFAAQGGLAQVPPPHTQPPPQWAGFNVPSKLRTSKKTKELQQCFSVFRVF